MSAVNNSRTIEKKIQHIQKLIEDVTADVIVLDNGPALLRIAGQDVSVWPANDGVHVWVKLGRKEPGQPDER